MKFGFVANQAKTEFFLKVALWLQNQGHDVFFLTTNKGWKKTIVAAGIPAFFLLNGKTASCPDTAAFAEKNRLRDRHFDKKGPQYAIRHAQEIVYQLNDIADQLTGAVIVGELTWLSELVLWSRQETFGYTYLMPHTIRFPSDRFAFFLGPNESEILPCLATEMQISEPKDLFWESLSRHNTSKRLRLLKSADLYDLADPAGRSILRLVKNKVIGLYRKQYSKITKLFDASATPPQGQGRKLYIALHLEPERSIVGFLPAGEDQLSFVERVITEADPLEVVVCFHPRQPESYSRYRRLKQQFPTKNLTFRNGLDRSLLTNQDVVATISGSLLGQLDTSISTVSGCEFFLTRDREHHKNVFSHSEFDSDKRFALRSPLSEIKRYAHQGIVADSYFVEACMQIENIKNIGSALQCAGEYINAN